MLDSEKIEAGYRRRAKLYLDPMKIRTMLDLPKGWGVVHVGATVDPVSFTVVVEGDDLDLVPPDVESPILPGWLAEQAIDPRSMLENIKTRLPVRREDRNGREEQVARYVDELLAVIPQGPYLRHEWRRS